MSYSTKSGLLVIFSIAELIHRKQAIFQGVLSWFLVCQGRIPAQQTKATLPKELLLTVHNSYLVSSFGLSNYLLRQVSKTTHQV